MRHYITFEKGELNSTITTLGFNIHKAVEQVAYFKQYAKIYGVEHDAVMEIAIEYINKAMEILNSEFNLPKANNCCLTSVSLDNKEVIERVNKNHNTPYIASIPKLKELISLFLAIAEREGKDTNWDGFKMQCKRVL